MNSRGQNGSWIRALLAFASFAGVSARAAEGLAWEPGPGYRRARLAVPSEGRAGFLRLPPLETGITFSNTLSDASIATNRLFEIGSGVALGDIVARRAAAV